MNWNLVCLPQMKKHPHLYTHTMCSISLLRQSHRSRTHPFIVMMMMTIIIILIIHYWKVLLLTLVFIDIYLFIYYMMRDRRILGCIYYMNLGPFIKHYNVIQYLSVCLLYSTSINRNFPRAPSNYYSLVYLCRVNEISFGRHSGIY